jgi:hypothetical protein
MESSSSLSGHGDDLAVSKGEYFQNSKFKILKITNSSFDYTTHHHNFASSSTHLMEADCQEPMSATMALTEPVNINQLFIALSTQITNQNNILLDLIKQNDLKMLTEFQLVVQANNEFKWDVRVELDGLRCLMSQQQNSTNAIGPTSSPVFSTSLPIPSSSLNSNNSTISTSSPGSYPSANIQTQMMMMLTESFSKLPTVLVDKNSDMKSE